jgi:predicted alpha/beta superfamily hydrolase
MAALRAVALFVPLLLSSIARAGKPVTIGETYGIHSTVLNEDRQYQVHLPESYKRAKSRRYPVLYVLDGKTHFVHTVGTTSFLAAQEQVPEMIVVAIASTVRVRDFTQSDWPKAWIGGGGADKFRRFLSTELIPAIEGTYRTDGFRILSGHSAGGQFALYCLTSEPALFRAYFALSSSLDWDDRLPVRSLKAALDAAPSLKAFLYVAREDDSGQALADYDSLVAALGSRKIPGFRWTSEAFPDERHSGTPLRGQIHALKALYAGYQLPEGLAEKGLAAVEAHYEVVSRKLGWPVPVPENAINELGYEALSRGKTDDAIALFKRCTDADPSSPNAWDSLADGYEKAGRLQDAANAADRAVELAASADDLRLDDFRRHAAKLHARVKAQADK